MSCSCGEPLYDAHSCTASAWVALFLLFGRFLFAARDAPDLRRPVAVAHRLARGTQAARRPHRERLLDDAVFERVIAENREATAGTQQLPAVVEQRFDLLELAVDRDAKRLERARRRIDAGLGANAGRAHGVAKLAGRAHRGGST